MTESGSTSDSPSLSGDESPPPLGTVAMSAEGARHALRQTRSRPSTADAIALGVAVPHRYEESRFGRFGRGMWSTGARRKRSGRAPAAYARSVTASALLLPGAAPPTHHRLARSRSLSRKEPSAPLLPGGCALPITVWLAGARSAGRSLRLLFSQGAAPPTHHRLARWRSLSRKEPSAPWAGRGRVQRRCFAGSGSCRPRSSPSARRRTTTSSG